MAAPASTLTSVAYIYKTTYASGIGEVAKRRHPLLSMMTTTGGFTGNNFTYPMRYGNPASVSGSFSNAQTYVSASKGLQFVALRKKKYGDITLDGESLMACDSKGSFLDLVTLETDAVITEHIDRLAFDLYRDGSGQRGRRASVSSQTITLSDPDTARNFKINMQIIASTNADGSSPRAGSAKVTAVSLASGTVTVDAVANITSFADNDYLFAIGDPSTCVEGLESLTPLTAPSPSESFRSVDRSVFPELLAGSRINDTTTTIEENAGLGAVYVDAAGGKCDSFMLNPIRFYQVARRLGAKVEYEGAGGQADYGFERILIHTAAGTLKCYADPDCPTNRGRGFLSSSHYYRTLGEQVHIIMDDGQPNLRQTDQDGIEARTRSMGNYIQTDTRNHFVIAI
jgi:hypothetical protein